MAVERLTCASFNELKKTPDQKTPSDQEVWSAIRYLDIEIDEKQSTRNAILAPVAALFDYLRRGLAASRADCEIPRPRKAEWYRSCGNRDLEMHVLLSSQQSR